MAAIIAMLSSVVSGAAGFRIAVAFTASTALTAGVAGPLAVQAMRVDSVEVSAEAEAGSAPDVDAAEGDRPAGDLPDGGSGAAAADPIPRGPLGASTEFTDDPPVVVIEKDVDIVRLPRATDGPSDIVDGDAVDDAVDDLDEPVAVAPTLPPSAPSNEASNGSQTAPGTDEVLDPFADDGASAVGSNGEDALPATTTTTVVGGGPTTTTPAPATTEPPTSATSATTAPSAPVETATTTTTTTEPPKLDGTPATSVPVTSPDTSTPDTTEPPALPTTTTVRPPTTQPGTPNPAQQPTTTEPPKEESPTTTDTTSVPGDKEAKEETDKEGTENEGGGKESEPQVGETSPPTVFPLQFTRGDGEVPQSLDGAVITDPLTVRAPTSDGSRVDFILDGSPVGNGNALEIDERIGNGTHTITVRTREVNGLRRQQSATFTVRFAEDPDPADNEGGGRSGTNSIPDPEAGDAREDEPGVDPGASDSE